MRKISLTLVLLLFLVPAVGHAEGNTLMLGVQSVSFGADLGNYYDISPGVGVTLLYAFDAGIPFDLRYGVRKTTEGISNDDLKYQWIEFGPRFGMGVRGTSLQPDWFLGIGSYDLEIGDKKFDAALGAYIGLGIEETMSEKFVGRIEIKSVYWRSDTGNTDGASLNLSLLYGFRF